MPLWGQRPPVQASVARKTLRRTVSEGCGFSCFVLAPFSLVILNCATDPALREKKRSEGPALPSRPRALTRASPV